MPTDTPPAALARYYAGLRAMSTVQRASRLNQLVADGRALAKAGLRSITVKSPEDSVLRKLLWYRQGGEVSTRQLRDVAGILAVNAGRLDEVYMDHWASTLQIEDLLASLRARIP